MRFFLRACFVSFGLWAALAFAQQPDLPKPETQEPATSPAASPSPMPDLIPPDVLSLSERAAPPPPALPILPTLPQLDEAFNKNPNQAAGLAQSRLEARELRNQVVNRESVRTARRAFEAASTDLQKRVLLRKYYEILYGEMFAMASRPELKAYLKDRKAEELNALPQPRVRPTPIPLKPKS